MFFLDETNLDSHFFTIPTLLYHQLAANTSCGARCIREAVQGGGGTLTPLLPAGAVDVKDLITPAESGADVFEHQAVRARLLSDLVVFTLVVAIALSTHSSDGV